jgi:putative peptidoglycan lipid II flippase
MDEAMALSLAFSLPAAAALVGMPFFLIDALFTRGAFTLVDAHQTANALFWYGLGTPAFVLTRILNQAFFARQDTKSPMRFALLSVGVNVVAGVALFFLMHGVAGIAAATALAAWLNVAQMLRALLRRGYYTPSAAAVSRLVRIMIASALLTGLLYLAGETRALYEPWLLHRKEIAVVLAVGVGAVVYLVLLFALRALTLQEIRAALRRAPRSADAIADNSL